MSTAHVLSKQAVMQEVQYMRDLYRVSIVRRIRMPQKY